jgi:hypothetical protein
MSGPTKSAPKHDAPRWGVWVFGLGIPIVIWSTLTTAAAAMGVWPIFDLTPALVLAAALLTRRWSGVPRRWVRIVSVLAAVMALQWVPWYVWMFRQSWPGMAVLNVLIWAYVVEMLALVGLFIVVATLSIRAIRRERAVDVAELVDAWTVES